MMPHADGQPSQRIEVKSWLAETNPWRRRKDTPALSEIRSAVLVVIAIDRRVWRESLRPRPEPAPPRY